MRAWESILCWLLGLTILAASDTSAQPIVPDGPELLFVGDPSGTAGPAFPDASAGAGGDVVLVWAASASSGGDESGSSVQAGLVAARGGPLGSAHQVNVATTGNQAWPRIAADETGYLVVWTDPADEAFVPPYLAARRVDAEGRPVGVEQRFAEPSEYGPTRPEPSLAVLPGSGFVVVWLGDGITTRGGFPVAQVRMRRLDATGEPLGEEIAVDDAPDYPVRAAVAGALDGRFVVAWSRAGDCSLAEYPFCPGRVSARRYDPEGRPIGSDLLVDQGLYVYLDRRIPVRATALPSGDFGVSWRGGFDVASGAFERRSSRAVAATEDAVGPVGRVDTESYRDYSGDIAATVEGSMIGFFEEQDASKDRDWNVVLREFDPLSGAHAPPLRVNQELEGRQYVTSLATAADGSILAVWFSTGADGSGGSSIRGRWLRRGKPIFDHDFETGDTIGWSDERP